MDTLLSCVEDISSLEKLYIKEQNLEVILNCNFSFFDSVEDLYVVIGYDIDHTFKNKTGKLLCGIVQLQKTQNGIVEKLVLPFSTKILFAKIETDLKKVLIFFKDGKRIVKRVIDMVNKELNIHDLDDILDDNYPIVDSLSKNLILCKNK